MGCRGTQDSVSDSLAVLRQEPEGLALVMGDLKLVPDYSEMVSRIRPQNLAYELLVRAAKVRGVEHPDIIDATAGLGQDSLLLAAAGANVMLFESNPTLFALLQDALTRAARDERLAEPVGRMQAFCEDSVAALHRLGKQGETPDVVYLDPMFPERHKSASVKKKFQLIHQLEQPCKDEKALLDAALAAHPRKIVIKRPLKAPCLADVRPSHSLSGKAIRFDVIVPTTVRT